MPRTITYTTQAAALSAQASIDVRIREFATAAGYSVDGSGYVSPKRFSDLATGAGQKTQTFGAVSGSGSAWSIPHPEYHSLRRRQLTALGKSYQSYVMQDLGAVTLAGTVDTFDITDPTAAGWAKHSPNAIPGYAGVGTFFDPDTVLDASKVIIFSSWRQAGGIARSESTDGGETSTTPTIVIPRHATLGDANRFFAIKLSQYDWRALFTRQLGNTMQVYPAWSTDGEGKVWTWSDTPVITPTLAWESQVDPVTAAGPFLYDTADGKFKMLYNAGAAYEPVQIGYAEATLANFANPWTKDASPVFSADTTRLWEQQFVASASIRKRNGYVELFYISYRSANEATISVVRSVNMKTGWERHANNPLIRKSQNSAEQDFVGCYHLSVFEWGSELRGLYNGRNDSLTYTENIMLATHVGSDLLW